MGGADPDTASCVLATAEEIAARLQPYRVAPGEGGPEEPGRGGVAGRLEEQTGRGGNRQRVAGRGFRGGGSDGREAQAAGEAYTAVAGVPGPASTVTLAAGPGSVHVVSRTGEADSALPRRTVSPRGG